MTRPVDSRSPRRPALVGLALLVATASLASAQESGSGDAVALGDTETRGVAKGSHRFLLYGGWHLGQTARDTQIEPAVFIFDDPIGMNIDVQDDAIFGVGYGYQFHEKWGLEVTYSQTSTTLANKQPLDEVDLVETLPLITFDTPEDAEVFADRIRAHAGPYDLDLRYFDVAAVYTFNPKGRWIGDVGAGIGWVDSSLPSDVVVFEQFEHTERIPGTQDPIRTANSTDADLVGLRGQCPTFDEPCIELASASGLTWNFRGGISYSFNPNVSLRFMGRLRFVEQVTDPGDSLLTSEATMGLTFLFGGN